MKIDKKYLEFIQTIKRQIVQSRYAAARLANKEQLMYLSVAINFRNFKCLTSMWASPVKQQNKKYIMYLA